LLGTTAALETTGNFYNDLPAARRGGPKEYVRMLDASSSISIQLACPNRVYGETPTAQVLTSISLLAN